MTTPLTAEQIEVAARKLCEIRGIDPCSMVTHGAAPDKDGFVLDILLRSPAWRIMEKEIVATYQCQQAIQHALHQGGGK